jgi:hypothetical protein
MGMGAAPASAAAAASAPAAPTPPPHPGLLPFLSHPGIDSSPYVASAGSAAAKDAAYSSCRSDASVPAQGRIGTTRGRLAPKKRLS